MHTLRKLIVFRVVLATTSTAIAYCWTEVNWDPGLGCGTESSFGRRTNFESDGTEMGVFSDSPSSFCSTLLYAGAGLAEGAIACSACTPVNSIIIVKCIK